MSKYSQQVTEFPTAKVKELVAELYHLVWTYLQTLWTIFRHLLTEKWQETTYQLSALHVYITTQGRYYYAEGSIFVFNSTARLFPSSWKSHYEQFYDYIQFQVEQQQQQPHTTTHHVYYVVQLLLDGQYRLLWKTLGNSLQYCDQEIIRPTLATMYTLFGTMPFWLQGLLSGVGGLYLLQFGGYLCMILHQRYQQRRRRHRRRRQRSHTPTQTPAMKHERQERRRQRKQKQQQRRRKKLHRKQGHSEIRLGRTSLVYGAATGALKDDDYLDGIGNGTGTGTGTGIGTNTGGGGRGRFNTFDFFGLNGPTTTTTTATATVTQEESTRTTTQRSRLLSDGENDSFGTHSSSHRNRTRTRSSESIGAMIITRPRGQSSTDDSYTHLGYGGPGPNNTTTLGGYLESMRAGMIGLMTFGESNEDGAASLHQEATPRTANNNYQKNRNNKTKNKQYTAAATTTTNPRLRKERLGSMDVFFAPGKEQPALKPGQCDAFGQQSRERIASDTTLTRRDDLGIVGCDERAFGSAGTNFRSMKGGHTPSQSSHHPQLYDNDNISTIDNNTDGDDYYDRRFDESFMSDGDNNNNNYSNHKSKNEDETTPRYLYDEFGVVTLSHRVEYYGPFKPILYCGSTLKQPLPYEEVSRKILSVEIELPLKRLIRIDILRGILMVVEPSTTTTQNRKWDASYYIDNVSIKFTDLDGGVVSIYNKEETTTATQASSASLPINGATVPSSLAASSSADTTTAAGDGAVNTTANTSPGIISDDDSKSSSKEQIQQQHEQEAYNATWKEHTFESTHVAAQFQLDFLAYQVLGKPLRHIFESLNLVHQGSLAYPGNEYVLHDNERGNVNGSDSRDENKKKNDDVKDEKNSTGNTKNKTVEASQCIAWDDAMRAMSSIPTVRIALERLWLSYRRPNEIASSFEEKDNKQKVKDGSNKNKGNKSNKKKEDPKNPKDKSKIALENDKVSEAELSLLKEEYTKNRLLLGPVDFYRLFVPTLPETAIPEGDPNNRGRMEQLLCWRKRVARASVLVRSYTRARLVANRGWKLEPITHTLPVPSSPSSLGDSDAPTTKGEKVPTTVITPLAEQVGETITKRFAYDGNENNTVRDRAAKNEIYEASVSRDVLCHVRPFDYLLNESIDEDHDDDDDDDTETANFMEDCESISSVETDFDYNPIKDQENHLHDQKHLLVLSPYQAYTYVSSHYFNIPEEMFKEGGPMHISRDPVDMFPSLKDLILRNPDLDFLFECTHNRRTLGIDCHVMALHLHVRSLAKGIDPQFDNVINRFSNSSEETRNRKLYLMFQMGNSVGISFWTWLLLTLLSIYFRVTDMGRDSPMNLESTRDRYGFPGFKLAGIFDTYHFGGSLVEKYSDKPKNYIGVTKIMAASFIENLMFGKIVFEKLNEHFLTSTVDWTFVIEGERNDELPERALSTRRTVNVNPMKVAKDPRPYLALTDDHGVSLFGRHNVQSYRDSITTGSNIEGVVHNAVQFSLQTIQSVAHLGLEATTYIPNMLSPNDKHDDKRDGDKRLRVITEDHETGVETISEDNFLNDLEKHGDNISPIEAAIDVVIEILRPLMIPSRHLLGRNPDQYYSKQRPDATEETGLVIVSRIPALQMFDRDDIGRFLRCNKFDIKVAAVKLAETAAWRGRTFPIDKRRCRIELQNGQFFQQGFDRQNNPVYYLRNLCRGPWRGDEVATILSILYRLDKTLNEFCRTRNPKTKATLIVLMGNSKQAAKKKKKRSDDEFDDSDVDDGDYELDDDTEDTEIPLCDTNAANPRISTGEKWMCHTSKEMLIQLIGILMKNYPGRLSKILIVKGRGKNHYYRDHIQGKWILKKLFKKNYNRNADKIKFVNKTSELTPYVPVENLLAIVGGAAAIDKAAYEFR